mmetsp:Transcript_53918/g.60279  ORF Transcript_53918/g.60279 Transcript_53918/m.60279 type:complete len:234 (-) Transcript_53918:353-1054(-)|eukprot:CAMPEP_0170785722 /NCGR_PEP_ID=MMETSP0733-20121128/17121_1 /TAXON_ID=186038 /ORGANISM="Fragilariopsis kerguelensis, Strain L26-C5" /LENGTH=233 /DNA_ID=CAMNT_0011131321 /DNA_START=47 /DNA_END=748 /DNA_ORIENTATION=-
MSSIIQTFLLCLLSSVCSPVLTSAFSPYYQAIQASASTSSSSSLKGVESEVSFGDLDGSDIRIGIIRTRWNDKHVTNLVNGCRKALKECKVKEENIFETSIPGAYELPLSARFLALSGTVDAIVTAGVLIKGETMHFEYISDTVSSGLMSVQLQTQLPVVYGVLNCMDEEQVKARSSGDTNHGEDWGRTAVEMALLRNEALNIKAGAGKANKLMDVGFSKATPVEEKKAPGFF